MRRNDTLHTKILPRLAYTGLLDLSSSACAQILVSAPSSVREIDALLIQASIARFLKFPTNISEAVSQQPVYVFSDSF